METGLILRHISLLCSVLISSFYNVSRETFESGCGFHVKLRLPNRHCLVGILVRFKVILGS